MLSQEQFEKIESEHGCGYWNLCWEHACQCRKYVVSEVI